MLELQIRSDGEHGAIVIVEVDTVTITRKRVEIPEACPGCKADLAQHHSVKEWSHGSDESAGHFHQGGVLRYDEPNVNYDRTGVLRYSCVECDHTLAEGGYVFGEGC